MEAFGILAIELMFLFACVTSGGIQTDLLSFIDPADYFASRRVDLRAGNMLELASASPTDAQSAVRQLLAVRWLGENKDRLGEHQEAVRQSLVRLARGPDGFAADYAQTALARIDGKPVPVPRAAPNDALREALEWFPKDVSLAMVLDTRPPPGGRPVAAPDPELGRHFQRVAALYLKMGMPGDAQEALYRFAESVGDWRLDRLAIGFALDPGASGNGGRVYFRGTGRMDHKRLAAYLRENLGRDALFVEKKGQWGESITTVAPRESPPAMALIGESDVILAGYTSDPVNCALLLEDMLAVRDGARPSLLTGPMGKSLRDVSPDARGLVRGTVPRDLVAAIARSPIGVAPDQMAIDLLSPSSAPLSPGSGQRGREEAVHSGLDLRFRGTLDNEAEARRFAEGLRVEIKQVIEALKELSHSSQLAGLATLCKGLEKIEVGSDGAVATARVPVSAETLQALLGLVEGVLPQGPGRAPNGR
jgi:hypothetical protein